LQLNIFGTFVNQVKQLPALSSKPPVLSFTVNVQSRFL